MLELKLRAQMLRRCLPTLRASFPRPILAPLLTGVFADVSQNFARSREHAHACFVGFRSGWISAQRRHSHRRRTELLGLELSSSYGKAAGRVAHLVSGVGLGTWHDDGANDPAAESS